MRKIFRHFILKYYQRIRVRTFKVLSNNSNVSGSPKINQPVQYVGKGRISFGKNVELGFFPSPYFYSGNIYIEARNNSAEIIIKDRVLANNNLVVVAEDGKIEIGENVLIGTNVEIINSDFHHINPQKRNSGEHVSKDVIIGNNVFLGSNVKICKGVKIGENTIIGNGSVVFESVPQNVIVLGNPAKVIKTIES